MGRRSLFAASVCSLAALAHAERHWAVLVAGSNGFYNYRHQADVCHAYHVLLARGFNPDQIITMSYDDVAHSKENPFPGKLFNKPAKSLEDAVDVYAGCKIDYTGGDVSPHMFMAVLHGDRKAAKGGRVLNSTAEDNVFVNFVDHGAVGLIAFPHGQMVLHAKILNETLHNMHRKGMYKQLTFYLETCESGSMFEGILPRKGLPVYAVTAASAKEPSFGTYCGQDAQVGDKSLQTCLGDLFSVNWMEDSDRMLGKKETMDMQFGAVEKATNKSHVQRYGEWRSFGQKDVSAFQNGDGQLGDGQSKPSVLMVSAPPPQVHEELARAKAVSSRDAKLHYFYQKYLEEGTPEAEAELTKEMQARREVKDLHAALDAAVPAIKDLHAALDAAAPAIQEANGDEEEIQWTPELVECHFRVTEAFGATCGWNEGRLSLSKVLYKLCHRSAGDHVPALTAIHAQCPEAAADDIWA